MNGETMDSHHITIVAVDDQAIIREGLKAYLDQREEFCVVGEASSGIEAIALVQELMPDVVLLDLLMPGMDGIETIQKILAFRPEQAIVVLTGYLQNDKLYEAIKAGALGFVRKDAEPEELLRSIERAARGEPSVEPMTLWRIVQGVATQEKMEHTELELSEREKEVLILVAKGYTDDEIGEELMLSSVTVRSHISRTMAKLGLKNRVQAALYALHTGLVPLESTSFRKHDPK
jgi:NarL family two-component system response regulator LiaR